MTNKGIINNKIYQFVLLLMFFGLFVLNVGSTFSGSNFPFLIILAVAVFFSFPIFISRIRHFVWDKSLILYFLFCVIALLSVTWASSKEKAFSGALVVILTLFVMFVFYLIVTEIKGNMYDIFCLICIASFFSFLYLMIRYGISIIWTLRNLSSDNFLYNANTVGRVYMIGAISGWIASRKKERKFVLKLLAIFLALLALFTGSKTVLLFGIIFGIVIMYLNNRGKKRALYIILIPLVLFVGYLLIMRNSFLYNIVGYRFAEILNLFSGDLEEHSSTWYRYSMMQNGIKLFLQKPILGWGMANASEYNVFEWAYEDGVYLHSNYLELLVDIGLLGTISYYSIYFRALRLNIKKLLGGDIFSKYFIAFLISILVTDVSAVSYLNRPTILIIFLAAIYGNNILCRLSNNYKNVS